MGFIAFSCGRSLLTKVCYFDCFPIGGRFLKYGHPKNIDRSMVCDQKTYENFSFLEIPFFPTSLIGVQFMSNNLK